MRVIGITGGVGAGKSVVLDFLAAKYNCRVIKADLAAKALEEPGGVCYEPLIALLGKEILDAAGEIDRRKMADIIFGSETLLQEVNAIVHPAVKTYLLSEIAAERESGKLDFFFIEAALLIEEGYAEILDELWYIRAGESIRRRRLKENRGYTDEKIDAILKSQLAEDDFLKNCVVVIENNGTLSGVYEQIEKELGDDQWQKQRNFRDN